MELLITAIRDGSDEATHRTLLDFNTQVVYINNALSPISNNKICQS